MTQTLNIFKIGLNQLSKDGLLVMLLPMPLLVGLLFKFGLPYANNILMKEFSFTLRPWYGLADGLLICLTPMFVAIISAFLILDERDEGVSNYYQITPVAGYSYLTARIGIPVLWSFIVTLIVSGLLNISNLSMSTLWTVTILSALTGIALSMLVVSLAANRVEGLAISKMMTVSFLGLILYWFVSEPYSYLFSFIPSFWVGKIIFNGLDIFSFLVGLLICFLWIIVFLDRFMKRI